MMTKLRPTRPDGELAGTVATLSYYLYAGATLLVAIGLIVVATLPQFSAISTIALAIGTSILASLIVHSIYGRIAEEHIVKKLATDTAAAALAYAQTVLHDQFTRVVPRRVYPHTSLPLPEFRKDIAEQLRASKFYRHKGDAASFAGFRLTQLAAHPSIASKEMVTLCVLDPRADRLMRQQARQKLTVKGDGYSKEDIVRKAAEIQEEIFITLVAMFDIAHLVRIEVVLHQENLFFRSELFENGLFVSYYLGGDYPGTYLFAGDTHVFEAFMLNFRQVTEYADYRIRFSDGLSEGEFCERIQELGCQYDIATLRSKRDAKYLQYLQRLPFEPTDLF